MTERERLIELIDKAEEKLAKYILHSAHDDNKKIPKREEMIADELLANCVVALPCKVGDTVYYIHPISDELCKGKITATMQNYYTRDICLHWVELEYYCSKIGWHTMKSRWDLVYNKAVFFTREEAEKALEIKK